jgi:D-alanine-D-alanine ligase
VTVGILGDRALPVVEIVPKAGVFDYEAKYTKGMTDYLTPAPLPEALAMALQEEALRLYRVCGCRDFARIDFMITPENDRILLEINTLPGMKETSLLPMGARCAGIDFSSLVREMIAPACDRLTRRTEGEVPS